MAIFKLVDNSYGDRQDMIKLVNYVLYYQKNHMGLYGGVGVIASNSNYVLNGFTAVKRLWHKEDKRQAVHCVVAFAPFKEDEIEFEQANQIAHQIACYFGMRYQVAYAIHDDHFAINGSLHIHFVINTVSYVDGYKFPGGKEIFFELLKQLRKTTTLKWNFIFGDEDEWLWEKQAQNVIHSLGYDTIKNII